MPIATISETFANADSLGGCRVVHAFNQRRDYGHWFQRSYLPGRRPDYFYGASGGANQAPGGLAALRTQTETYGGVCWAMSIQWILRHSRNEDFWSWIETPKGISTLVNLQMKTRGFAGALQASALGQAPTQVPGGPRRQQVEEMVLTADVLVRIGQRRGTAREDLIDAVGEVGPYMIIALSFTGLPIGHAMAAHNAGDGGDVTIFDPNGGEVVFSDREKMRNFLFRLLYQTAYADISKWRINQYDESIGLTQLFPPN